MPEFAKIFFEAIDRRHELKFRYEKRYQHKAFELYIMICLHRYDPTGICNKNIHQIIEIHELHYDNTMRRYKLLRQKGWIEVKRGKIRPLMGFVKTVNSTVSEKDKTVNSTVETVNSTVFEGEKTVNSTVKTVNSTVSFIPYRTELEQNPKSAECAPHTLEAPARGVSVESKVSKSIFSYEECLRYAEVCRTRGEHIRSVPGLADYLFTTGERDALIQATLYPETAAEQEFEEAIVYEYDSEGNFLPKSLSKKQLSEALKILMELSDEFADVDEFRKWYTPEDWAYLMKELEVRCGTR